MNILELYNANQKTYELYNKLDLEIVQARDRDQFAYTIHIKKRPDPISLERLIYHMFKQCTMYCSDREVSRLAFELSSQIMVYHTINCSYFFRLEDLMMIAQQVRIYLKKLGRLDVWDMFS